MKENGSSWTAGPLWKIPGVQEILQVALDDSPGNTSRGTTWDTNKQWFPKVSEWRIPSTVVPGRIMIQWAAELKVSFGQLKRAHQILEG